MITRRDFVNGVLVGSGARLLSACAPVSVSRPDDSLLRVGNDWYGYGGVGDYALSHGNTPDVVNTAHAIRDGAFDLMPANMAVDEEYDLVVIGAGMAGLGAAWHFRKRAQDRQRCLVLENHPMFGGEAKENVFDVDGFRLVAPQGSNGFFMPPPADDPEQSSGDARYYAEFGIPRDLRYADMEPGATALDFCRDNYGFLHWTEDRHASTGYFYGAGDGYALAKNIWANDLQDAPLSDDVRQDVLAWRQSRSSLPDGEAKNRLLDSMTYKDYLEAELGLGPHGAAYANDFMASAFGLGSDAVSAYAASMALMPGTVSDDAARMLEQASLDAANRRHSFPGGNSAFARYFVKNLIPAAIGGGHTFEDIVLGRIDFDALDRAGQRVRLRLGSTVVAVQHDGPVDTAKTVSVFYTRGGRLRRVRASGVVMATGGWVNGFVGRDMPESIRQAYSHFIHAPFLVVNVALDHWRFMHEMGITGAQWDSGFGFSCNIRSPMRVGETSAPLHPDKPIVLTFYVPFHTPGFDPRTQVTLGRAELLGTGYSEYERRIRRQLTRLFAPAGFDHQRDIRGIVLNRWGHAYVVSTPGLLLDTATGRSPRNTVMNGYGRVAIGHSELEGLQHWGPAADQGRRAAQRLLEVMNG